MGWACCGNRIENRYGVPASKGKPNLARWLAAGITLFCGFVVNQLETEITAVNGNDSDQGMGCAVWAEQMPDGIAEC